MILSKLPEYGEFKCPYCNAIFHEKKKLMGHIGGAHKKGQGKIDPRCKFCNTILIEGKNWPKWAVKQKNLICITCKRIQNRESYRKRFMKKEEK